MQRTIFQLKWAGDVPVLTGTQQETIHFLTIKWYKTKKKQYLLYKVCLNFRGCAPVNVRLKNNRLGNGVGIEYVAR